MGRLVAYAQEGIYAENGIDHAVALVEENEPGYWLSTYTGTLDYCERTALSINESLGIEPDDAVRIVASSISPGAIA
jgi:hypothetical protein